MFSCLYDFLEVKFLEKGLEPHQHWVPSYHFHRELGQWNHFRENVKDKKWSQNNVKIRRIRNICLLSPTIQIRLLGAKVYFETKRMMVQSGWVWLHACPFTSWLFLEALAELLWTHLLIYHENNNTCSGYTISVRINEVKCVCLIHSNLHKGLTMTVSTTFVTTPWERGSAFLPIQLIPRRFSSFYPAVPLHIWSLSERPFPLLCAQHSPRTL